jgi:hypothetical protein
MATRSIIAIRNADSQFQAIYCHWDGYLSNNGRILAENYTDEDKVRKLIALGNISSLGPYIGNQHNFDNAPRDECNAYGRDRGEADQAARLFVSFQHLQNSMAEEFTYVFDTATGVWSVAYGDSVELKPLLAALVSEAA